MKNGKNNSALQLWGAPFLLAVLTLFGLVAALVGAGVWHVLAWLSIAAPVAVCLWYGGKPRRRRS